MPKAEENSSEVGTDILTFVNKSNKSLIPTVVKRHFDAANFTTCRQKFVQNFL